MASNVMDTSKESTQYNTRRSFSEKTSVRTGLDTGDRTTRQGAGRVVLVYQYEAGRAKAKGPQRKVQGGCFGVHPSGGPTPYDVLYDRSPSS